jgi:hypothetical protein
MKKYFFFVRKDKSQERISSTSAMSRLSAAKYFAKIKNLKLKDFLNVFEVSR